MFVVELATFALPFDGIPEEEVQRQILAGKLPPSVVYPSPSSALTLPQFLPLIKACLKLNPTERYTALQIYKCFNP